MLASTFEIFVSLWPGDVRCVTICKPERKGSTEKFARQRLRQYRRKADYPNAKVVVNPISD